MFNPLNLFSLFNKGVSGNFEDQILIKTKDIWERDLINGYIEIFLDDPIQNQCSFSEDNNEVDLTIEEMIEFRKQLKQ